MEKEGSVDFYRALCQLKAAAQTTDKVCDSTSFTSTVNQLALYWRTERTELLQIDLDKLSGTLGGIAEEKLLFANMQKKQLEEFRARQEQENALEVSRLLANFQTTVEEYKANEGLVQKSRLASIVPVTLQKGVPNDCWGNIFEYSDIPDLIFTIPHVSKAWKSLALRTTEQLLPTICWYINANHSYHKNDTYNTWQYKDCNVTCEFATRIPQELMDEKGNFAYKSKDLAATLRNWLHSHGCHVKYGDYVMALCEMCGEKLLHHRESSYHSWSIVTTGSVLLQVYLIFGPDIYVLFRFEENDGDA